MNDSVISLFSGAGGFSLGFSKAGLRPVFAADIDKSACETYLKNLGIISHNLDLGQVEDHSLNRLLAPFSEPLAVIGGPPCQGFSTAGTRRGDDPRNELVFRYLDIVDRLKPRWFLFENVEGILTSNGGESVRDLLGCFISRGYVVRLEKLNFAGFGLPQSRKRVLIVGNRMGHPFSFPIETHSFTAGKHKGIALLPPGPSFFEAIQDLPEPDDELECMPYYSATVSDFAASMREGNESGCVTLHYANSKKSDLEKFRLLLPGQTMKDLPEDCWHPSFKARAFRRVSDGMPTEKRGGAPAGIRRLIGTDGAPTITGAACREFVHPNRDRTITLREAARLQSFPDKFQFSGGQAAIAQQIGNAVPPLAAEVLGRHLAQLEGLAGGWRGARHVTPGLLGFRLTDALGKSPALQATERLLSGLPTSTEHGEIAYGT